MSKPLNRKTPSIRAIASKHKVSVQDLAPELAMGVEVELEHTKSRKVAREIALDHLNELPDYYTRLKKMENH